MIMLTMKKDSEVNCPSTDEIATVTMMDTTAMLMGMIAATRAPNTKTRTIIAAGSPNLSSPLVEVGFGQRREVMVEGVDPGDVDVEGRCGSAAVTSSSTSTIPVSGSSLSTRVTTAACLSWEIAGVGAGVGVIHDLHRTGSLDREPEVGDEGLELRSVGGEPSRSG